MDMPFANQALCTEHLVRGRASMPPGVYPVPVEIDRKIAALKLRTMNLPIDRPTAEQVKYMSSWDEGT
jgi:adenosylhomocysteinase